MSQNFHQSANPPIRLTIIDPIKTISLPGDALLAHHLTGACAADPRTFEELLPSTEPYQPGITARVINALLYFDRRRFQNQTVKINPLNDVFEVEDSYLERLSLEALPGGLITFNLAKRLITTAAADLNRPGEQLKREAELPVLENGKLLSKTITYNLNRSWKFVGLEIQSGTIQMRTNDGTPTISNHSENHSFNGKVQAKI